MSLPLASRLLLFSTGRAANCFGISTLFRRYRKVKGVDDASTPFTRTYSGRAGLLARVRLEDVEQSVAYFAADVRIGVRECAPQSRNRRTRCLAEASQGFRCGLTHAAVGVRKIGDHLGHRSHGWRAN